MTNDAAAGAPAKDARYQIFGWSSASWLSLILAIGILIGPRLDRRPGERRVRLGRPGGRAAARRSWPRPTGRLEERVADLDALLTEVSSVAGNVTVPPSLDRASLRHRRPVQPDPRWLGRQSGRASTPRSRRSPSSIAPCRSSTSRLDRPRSWPRSTNGSPRSTPTSPGLRRAWRRRCRPSSKARRRLARRRRSRGRRRRPPRDGSDGGPGADRSSPARRSTALMWLTTIVLLLLVALRRVPQRDHHPAGPSRLGRMGVERVAAVARSRARRPAAKPSPTARAAKPSPAPAAKSSPPPAEEVASPPPADAT